jgi:hypothetical protein
MNMNIDDIEDIPLTPKGLLHRDGQGNAGTRHILATADPILEVQIQRRSRPWIPTLTGISSETCGGLNAIEIQHSTSTSPTKPCRCSATSSRTRSACRELSVAQAVAESVGKQCKVHVSHRPTQLAAVAWNGRPSGRDRLLHSSVAGLGASAPTLPEASCSHSSSASIQ